MSFVEAETTGGVATVTLERGKVNALNDAVVDELAATFEALRRDAAVGAVVLTGRGKFFSFGFDIPELLPYTQEDFAAFLARHPKVSEVFHPSLPSHPDAKAIARDYVRHGSMLSFRIAGADEERTRHYADVLATCVIVRYALSFDGVATKVNHHKTVSEYFTPIDRLQRNGFDRLIRLAVGLEDADDLCAALNWTLHHGDDDIYRARLVYLGPPGYTLPIHLLRPEDAALPKPSMQ